MPRALAILSASTATWRTRTPCRAHRTLKRAKERPRAGRFTPGMTNSARNVAGDRMVLADLAGRVLCTDAVEHRLRCDATASAVS